MIAGFGGGFAMAVGAATAEQAPAEWLVVFGWGLVAIFLSVPILQRADWRPGMLRHLLIAVASFNAIALFGTTGGSDIGGVLIAVMLPLISVLMCGPRGGIAWSALVLVALVATNLALRFGYEPLLAVDPVVEARWSLLAGAATVVTSLCIALGYDQIRRATLRRLAAERARADRAHGEKLESEAKFRGRLEALVEERSRALTESQAQLRRADRLAAIGTLAAGVAHQINNPIGSILLSAEVALAEAEGPDRHGLAREALAKNAAEAQRVGRIVRNLLTFARYAPGEKTELDLNEVARLAVHALDRPDDAVELRPAKTPLPITGSPIELEQVILNLMHNALESGHPSNQPIRLETLLDAEAGELRVSDRGRGIAPEDLEHVFDPFFTTRVRDGGTGLGLSLAHGIVEEHGGRIDVESAVDVGTSIRVRLPLRR